MLITKFSSGELSENLRGRVDLQQYYEGVSRLENFDVIPTGGVKRRTGTERIGKLSGACRLIPFILDKDTSFVFEVTADKMYIWKNGEKVLDEQGDQVTVELPYTNLEEVRAIQYAQNFDTMIMVQQNHSPVQVVYNFALQAFEASEMTFDFIPDVVLDDDFDFIKIVTELPTTASAGDYVIYNGKLYKYTDTWEVQGTDFDIDTQLFTSEGKYPSCVTFFNSRLFFASTKRERQKVWASAAPDTRANRYNDFSPFKKYVTVDRVLKDNDAHVFTGDIVYNDGAYVRLKNLSYDVVSKLVTDVTNYYAINSEYIPTGTKVKEISLGEIVLDWQPTAEEIETGSVSRVTMTLSLFKSTEIVSNEDYEFKVLQNNITTADCSFFFEIASEQNDAIKWLTANRYMTVGTESSVWCLPNSITALSINAEMNGRYGSDEIQAHTVGDAVIFFAQGKRGIREYYYDNELNAFQTNNIAILAEQMLIESPVVEFDFMTNPYNKIMAVREDGIIAQMLYDKTNGISAWSRLKLANGSITSCAVVRGNSYTDIIYLVVRKNNEYFLERIDDADGMYLDHWVEFSENVLSEYTPEAIIFDKTKNYFFPVLLYEEEKTNIEYGDEVYIGYAYESLLWTMPVLNNDATGKKRIAAILPRFCNSYLPKAKCEGMADEYFTDIEPYSGLKKLTFPGVSERDVSFGLSMSKPYECKVLTIEAQLS